MFAFVKRIMKEPTQPTQLFILRWATNNIINN